MQRKSKLKDCKTAKRKTGAEAEKNRTAEKEEFFEVLLQLKSKNFEQRLASQLYVACCQKNSDQKNDLLIYHEFFRQEDRICFWTASTNFDLSCSLRLNLAQSLKSKDKMMLLQ